jgi:hypothetical protein
LAGVDRHQPGKSPEPLQLKEVVHEAVHHVVNILKGMKVGLWCKTTHF